MKAHVYPVIKEMECFLMDFLSQNIHELQDSKKRTLWLLTAISIAFTDT